MKKGVQSIVAAAAVAYDPKSGLETAKTVLDNLKHSLERIDQSAAMDVKAMEVLVETHKGKAAYNAGYGYGHSQGVREGVGKALVIISIELDKLAAEGNKN